jgi:hypothetical protein
MHKRSSAKCVLAENRMTRLPSDPIGSDGAERGGSGTKPKKLADLKDALRGK